MHSLFIPTTGNKAAPQDGSGKIGVTSWHDIHAQPTRSAWIEHTAYTVRCVAHVNTMERFENHVSCFIMSRTFVMGAVITSPEDFWQPAGWLRHPGLSTHSLSLSRSFSRITAVSRTLWLVIEKPRNIHQPCSRTVMGPSKRSCQRIYSKWANELVVYSGVAASYKSRTTRCGWLFTETRKRRMADCDEGECRQWLDLDTSVKRTIPTCV
jgi:hypothetical protein